MSFVLLSAFRGLVDSFSGCRVVLDVSAVIDAIRNRGSESANAAERNLRIHLKPVDRTEIRRLLVFRVIQCVLLNGLIFWLSLYFWGSLLLPLLEIGFSHSDVIAPILRYLFSTLWVIPLFIISRIVNFLWFQDVADWTFYQKHGRTPKLQSISKLLADTLFSLVIQTLFLIQEAAVRCIPIPVLPQLMGTVHLCFLYSLYAFEYKWFSDGWALHIRLQFVEVHWPYFLGFGLPLALLTTWSESFLVRGCVFYLSFPLLIIAGNLAKPVLSPQGFFPLKLFTPVVKISDYVLQRTVERHANIRRTR